MAKASPAQVSFNAGEWSSRLEGRSDLAKYGNACRHLLNFLPTVQGPAIKRSGTRFVKEVRESSYETRLIPFEFGTEQAYILEFSGNSWVRVYKDSAGVLEGTFAINAVSATSPIVITTTAPHGYSDGQQVFVSGSVIPGINSGYFTINVTGATTFELLGTTSNGAGGAGGTVAKVYEFLHNYLGSDLAAIQYAQSADVLYLAHPAHPPRKLSRTGHTSWTLEEIAFDAPPFSQENLDKDEYIIATGATGSISLYSTGGRFTPDHVGSYVKLAEILEGKYPEWSPNADPVTRSSGAIGQYQVNNDPFKAGDNIYAHYQGRLYRFLQDYGETSSGPSTPLHDMGVQYDGCWDWQYVNSGYGWAIITAVTDAYLATATVVREFGRTVFSTPGAITAISAANRVTDGAHGFETGDVVFLYGTLRAGLNNLAYNITRFDANNYDLTSRVDGGVVDVGGAVGAGGVGVRARRYANSSAVATSDQNRKTDTSRWAFGAFSTERGYPACVAFFEDRLLWAGTYSDPQGIWASRTGRYEDHLYTDEDDGALFLLLNTQQVNRIEWVSAGRRLAVGTAGGEFVIEAAPDGPLTAGSAVARQQTYHGSRASVAPVRIESVTLFAQRSGRKLIEFGYDYATQQYQGQDLAVLAHHLALPKIKGMAWAQEPDRTLWIYFEDGSLAGLTYDRAQEVVGWHPHVLGGVFGSGAVVVESIAVIPHPDGDRAQVWFVVKRTVNGATVRHVEFLEETWIRGTAIEDGFFVDAGLTYDGAPSSTMYGLWHLIGQTLRVLADGVEVDDAVVSATGQLTLGAAASVVQAGLAFDAELEPMLLEAGGADGTAQGKTKRATNIVLRLEDTGAGLTYGIAEDELAITPGTLLTDDTEILPWPDGYTKRQRIPIAHAGPTPCTLVAIFPQVKTEDR